MAARAELILGLRGNLVQGLRQGAAEFQRTQTVGQRAMSALSRTSAAAGRGIDRLGNRYAALVGGAAAIGAARFVVGQERRLTRLGIAANLTAEQVAALNQSIYDTAQAPEIRADPSEILAAIEAIVEKTGDLDFARNNLRLIAMGIQATGAGGLAVGELVAEFQKLGEVDPQNVLKLLDTLNVQGKTGAFTLANLAALGPRVITAYAGSVKGVRDNATVMREMGAALQTIRQGTGSSEQAATAFERLLSELQSAEKQKGFRKLGIQIFEFGKGGVKALRPINELMLEFLEKTKGDRTKLGSLFGDESIRAFNSLKPELIQSFMDVQGDGAQTMADSARAANDAAGAMQNLSTAWKSFADTNLTPLIQDLADGLNQIGPGTVEKWAKVGAKVAIVLGGIIALRKILLLSRGLASVFSAGKAAPGVAGGLGGGLQGALGGLPLPLPVYVVNNKMSLLPGELGGKPGGVGTAAGGAAASNASRLATAAKFAGGVAVAGAAGYAVGTGIYKVALDGTQAADVIGAGIARVLALFGNEEAQAAIAARRGDHRALGQSETPRARPSPLDADDGTPGLVRRDAAEAPRSEVNVGGVLRIQIDAEGRPRVRELRSNAPGFDLDVYTGPMMSTP